MLHLLYVLYTFLSLIFERRKTQRKKTATYLTTDDCTHVFKITKIIPAVDFVVLDVLHHNLLDGLYPPRSQEHRLD